MSYAFGINLTPANGSIAMWNLINKLLTNGWTKIEDSDGTTYSNSGSQVTGGNSGANGLGNQYAYVRIQGPDGNRELVIQSTFSDTLYWRIKYSYLAGFTTTAGTPIVTVPAASDEYVLIGSGTDASPGTSAYLPNNGTYSQFIVVDTVTGAFACLLLNSGTGVVNCCFIMDVLASNTYPNTDVDPVVFYFNPYSNTDFSKQTSFGNESVGPFSILKRGMMGEGFVRTPAITYTLPSGVAIPNGLGVNPYNTNDLEFPIIYARYSGLSSPHGYKGISSLMKYVSIARSVGDTYNSKTRVVFGDLTFPFDGSSSISV